MWEGRGHLRHRVAQKGVNRVRLPGQVVQPLLQRRIDRWSQQQWDGRRQQRQPQLGDGGRAAPARVAAAAAGSSALHLSLMYLTSWHFLSLSSRTWRQGWGGVGSDRGRGRAMVRRASGHELRARLAARLPPDSITLNQKVVSLDAQSVTLSSGEQIRGRAVVLATNAASVGSLLPDLRERMPEWRSVTNLYFYAPSSPINESIICLNGSGEGVVNNVCALTDVSPDYSPDERALISVSVLGLHPQEGLPAKVQQELMGWFGECVAQWCHLRTDLIPEALPEQTPMVQKHKLGYIQQKGIYVCGDHVTSASIEGVVISGKRAAEAIIMRRLSVL